MNLVFASGVLVPQHLLKFDYFRAARAAFPTAIFPPVPITAGVDERAAALAEQIDQAFPTGPIHIIAHSMGGLDARCALSRNLRGLANPGRVASLSTISTPHRGSPLADLLVSPAPEGQGIRAFSYSVLRHAFDKLGVSVDALGDLTSDSTAAFNMAHPDVAHIAYRSFAGRQVNTIALIAGHHFIEAVGKSEDTRTNDGIVSVASARWGEFDELAVARRSLRRNRLRPEHAHARSDLRPHLRVSHDSGAGLRTVIRHGAGEFSAAASINPIRRRRQSGQLSQMGSAP